MNLTHLIVRLFRVWWPIVVVAAGWTGFGLLNVSGAVDTAPFTRLFNAFRRSGDFDSYYAGAACARYNRWDCLYWEVAYTDENPTIDYPASYHPWLIKWLSERSVPDVNPILRRYKTPWVYPPQLALTLAPMSFFPYNVARRFWITLNGLFLCLFLWLLGNEFSEFNISARKRNWLLLAIGFSMPVQNLFQHQNISVLSALAVLATFRGLRSSRDRGCTAGLLFLGFSKGTPVLWIPLLVIWQKWKLVFRLIFLGGGLLLLPSIFGCSFGVYFAFVKMVSLVSQCFLSWENLCFPAVFLFEEQSRILRASIWILVCSWVYWRNVNICRTKQSINRSALVGSSLFLSLLVFQACSPVCWIHYRLLLFAFLPFVLSFIQGRRNLTFLFWIGFFLFAGTCNDSRHLLFCLQLPVGASWTAYCLWIVLAFIMFDKASSFPETNEPKIITDSTLH